MIVSHTENGVVQCDFAVFISILINFWRKKNILKSNKITISISDSYEHIEDDPILDIQHNIDIVKSDNIDQVSAASISNHQNWSTQSGRIQSMVVQNDGSIILCDNDIASSAQKDLSASRPRIEVVEILSPTNYIRGNKTN